MASRPKITKGSDGLPHCAECEPDGALCDYHDEHVGLELGSLKTADTMARSDFDLRFHIKRARHAKRSKGVSHADE